MSNFTIINNDDIEESLEISYFGSIETSSDYVPKVDVERNIVASLRDLIWQGNNDFIPPLSYRKGSAGYNSVASSVNLESGNIGRGGIEDYIETMFAQKNILVYKTGDAGKISVVAFMSFRHDYDVNTYIPQVAISGDIINYITTFITREDYRRKGLLTRMYDYIETTLPESVHGNIVATRTWHTNISHLKMLEKRDYVWTTTLHNERVFNDKMYDTVYYAKRVSREQKQPKRSN